MFLRQKKIIKENKIDTKNTFNFLCIYFVNVSNSEKDQMVCVFTK